MANSGAIKAGKAYVELFADRSRLVSGLKAGLGDLKAFGKSAIGVGKLIAAGTAAAAVPIAAAVKLFSDTGSELNDMAARTGASVEALSTLGFAAEQTGASMEDVETGMRKLAKSGKFAGMSTDAAFRAALDKLASIPDASERSRQAMEMFGKSGTSLIPMAMELKALEDRARSLGLQMSTEDAAAADALGDSWGELLAVGKMLVVNVGAALAPAFQSIIESLVELAASTNNWIQANRETIDSIMLIATSGRVLWAALKLGWTEGTVALETSWQEFLSWMAEAAGSIAKSISDQFVDMAMSVVQSILKISDVISKALGKDLIDPTTRQALGMALPFIGAAAKQAAPGAIDSFVGGVQGDSQAKIAALQAELAAARENFDATKATVQAERDAKKAALAKEAPAVTDAVGELKTSVSGTFSAAAAGGIAGSRMDDIATATKQTAANTKRLLNRQQGIAFV